MQGYQQWLTLRQPLSCREAEYGFFDRVQFTDTLQRFLCCRHLSTYIDVVDFSARMGPTCSFG